MRQEYTGDALATLQDIVLAHQGTEEGEQIPGCI